MIRTVVMISLRRLLHNRVELLLAFVVPIAFFSIFALIFGKGIGSGATPKIKVVTVQQTEDPDAQAVVDALRDSGTLRLMQPDGATKTNRDQAIRLVRSGSVSMAIVVSGSGSDLSAEILADSSDQVAPKIVSALVGRSLAMLRRPNVPAAPGTFTTERPTQNSMPNVIHQPTDEATPASIRMSERVPIGTGEVPNQPLEIHAPPVNNPVQIVDVIGDGKSNPVVSMYAAGIAVMFLLFGASGGGGALLEERENQTLDRLLSTHLTMDDLLLGKWFYLMMLGVVQVCVMFVWGQYVFGIDVWGHLDGFLMMTIVTAGAAAAFGLFLATLCKTRGQLNGLSVILILSMSALGGSMVPRYVMSQEMRDAGLWTFNAWALDGYNKVFWRELPVETLWPQLTVLVLSGVVFLLAARALAVRWETN